MLYVVLFTPSCAITVIPTGGFGPSPGVIVTWPVEVPAVEITDPNADIVALGSDFVAVKVILPTRRPTFTL